ncbi:MAG TPA: class I SAM-dependent methyltransferase [Usitatibacter sp.]|jgi:cyclopropane fatty-acyl-phospholipid synthase-like methyltransferase|nr:class I SAM-dependent methyltransferase [Usitatibacter sp.]
MATYTSDPAQLHRWNTRFSADGYLFGTEPNAFLAAQRSRLKPGMRALCIADGDGRNSVFLARQGLEVTAFDFSPVAVEKAKRLARDAGVNVDYRQSDILAWQWEPSRYDVIAAIFFQFLDPAQRAKVFSGLEASLAPGGLLLLQGYRPEQIANATGGPKDEENMYTEALLRESFRDLEIIHLASHDEVLTEGTAHRGISALIDLVARRSGADDERAGNLDPAHSPTG